MIDVPTFLHGALILAIGMALRPCQAAGDGAATVTPPAGHLAAGYRETHQAPVKLPAHLIHVPLARQATDYTCGAAALQSLLGYYGEDFREDELSHKLHSDPKDGTAYQQIEGFCRQSGYTTSTKTNMTLSDLTALIDQGKPVIVLLQAWADGKTNYSGDWDDGHYAIAIGHDANRLFFMDPSTLGNYTYIPTAEFLERWHDTNGKDKLVHFGLWAWKAHGSGYKPDQVNRME